MNPLTQVKNTQKVTAREAALGISEAGSWHATYKDSPYVYAGNFSFDLTEGDLLAIFAQYGEIVDLNLVRDKATGKSRGFAFLAYEDQRSTVLAVDNLNGATVVGRTIKVDHVAKYKKKEEEDEEGEQQKREERGVCRAFQRGECTRGSACKFSHDEKRSANTGWGSKEDDARWGHDRYDGGSRQAYRTKDEDGGGRDNRSGVKERKERGSSEEGGKRGHSHQGRERTEKRSGYGSERDNRASARKGHDDEYRSYNGKHRDEDDGRGQEESRRERVSSRERDHESRDWDDRKDSSRHRRDNTKHGRGDDKESEGSKRSRTDDYYSSHRRSQPSYKERRDDRD